MKYEESAAEAEYQYHLKDHLGNVRLTFTTKQDEETYTATFEDNTREDEENTFQNYHRTYDDLFDYTDAGAVYVHSQMLHGGHNRQVGLAKTLSVMPGDTIKAEVYAKYQNLTSTPSGISGFAAALTEAFELEPGEGEAGLAYVTLDAYGAIIANGYDHSEDSTAVKAYLNILLFDKDHNFVDAAYKQIGENDVQEGIEIKYPHGYLNREIVVRQPGYAYIFLSNENPTQVDVYFDDLKIAHMKSPVVQMDDYYPFGLTFNSFMREGTLENKWKFQEQEHVDDLNLGWDSFKWRNHQPDIGRFFNIDPLAEKYVYNSPYAFSENHVVAHRELEGLEKVLVTAAEFTAHQKGKTIYTGGGAQKYEDKNVYNRNFQDAPDGGEYKKLDAKVETSNGEVLYRDPQEGGDGVIEEFFDMFTGDIDNFDYSLEGNDTKSGSRLRGNVEDAKFSIDITISEDVMTLTTNMTGGDVNKAYSIKIANGDGSTGQFVIGTLKSGRDEGKGSTTTISIPFTVDKNGNAVFDSQKWSEMYDKSKNESTRR